MIRTLRTRRDDQQWMLDLALNMRGRVQNFEGDGPWGDCGWTPTVKPGQAYF